MHFTEKGFPPALYTKQPTENANDRCWGGSSTVTPKRNDRERAKETNADNGGSTKTKKPRDRCAHRALPLGSKTPKRRHQSTPPRRIVTMTTLLPRVSPGTRQGERKGSPDALQEGPAAPSGATASVSAKPTGISPDPILHLRHSGARHQTDHHPAPTRTRSFPRCLTTAPRSMACTMKKRSRD